MKLHRLGWFGLAAVVIGACTAVETNPFTTGGTGGGTGGGTSSSSSASSSSGGAGTCTTAADCPNSGDECNMPACINGVCGALPTHELMACDDGINCTDNTVCMNGKCAGGTLKFC